jgi:tetratricopeptide (TPR) repeat protein
VPRWFAEGLSVYEERRARPAWGEDPSPLFLAAFAGGRLPKVSRLNDGFLHPSFPAQVILSYYLASLVCEMIDQEQGTAAIRAMLAGYRDGKTTDQLLRDVLKTEPAAFDARAEAWVRKRFERQLAAVKPLEAPRSIAGQQGFTISGDFPDALNQGKQALAAGKTDEAIASLERAKSLFPEYALEDGPYALLARIHTQRGARQEAARELSALTAINDQAIASNLALADLLEGLGDNAGAAAALDRAVWINPFDKTLHDRLAALAAKTGDRRTVIRERQALVALDPVDRVEALYQLAIAYFEAGDAASARREVLRALELAPNFEKGQELLLRLRGGRSPGGTG